MRFAGASGPDLVTAALRRGLAHVIRSVERSFAQAQSRLQAERGDPLTPDEQRELRQVIYAQVAVAARERYAELKLEREQREQAQAER